MVATLKKIARMTKYPSVEMLFGILIMVCGFLEAINEIEDVEKGFFEAHYAFIILSLLIIFKAFGVIMVGMSRFTKAKKRKKIFNAFNHVLFEVVLSIGILLAGVSELIEYLLEDHIGVAGSVWFYAMIFWGSIKFIKCMVIIIKTVMLSLMTVQEIENETHKSFRWINKINKILRKPSFEIGVAVLIVVFCIIEEVIMVSSDIVTEHRILLIHGVFTLIKNVATLSDVVEIIDDTIMI